MSISVEEKKSTNPQSSPLSANVSKVGINGRNLRILLTGDAWAPEWFKNKLKDFYPNAVFASPDKFVDEPLFCKELKNYDVYICWGREVCTRRVIEAAKGKLKAIIFPGVDYQYKIDSAAAKENQIPIFNMPGSNAIAVAEYTFNLMSQIVRKSPKMQADIAAKKWQPVSGSELHGKTLGLIGGGNIAAKVARIAKGYEMNVIYWSRSGPKETMKDCSYKPLNEVVKASDIVSLHVPAEAGTLMDKEMLNMMKQGSFLINTARPNLVDDAALYSLIKEGKIAGAAFDGFYNEGSAYHTGKGAQLLTLAPEQFILTPHAAWFTSETNKRQFEGVLDCLAKIPNRD